MIKRKPLKTMLAPTAGFVKYRILHVDDSPHRIALGVALGLFVAYLPSFGFHLILLVILSFIFKANKFVALACVWISNPLTFIPIYYPNYLIGRSVLACFRDEDKLAAEQITGMFKDSFSIGNVIICYHTSEFWENLGSFLIQTGLEMSIGGVIVGGIIGTGTYFATYHIVIWHRRKHPHLGLQQ